MTRARVAVALAVVLAAATSAAPAAADTDSGRPVAVVLRDDALDMGADVIGAVIDFAFVNRGSKVHELAVQHVRPGTTLQDALDAAAAGVERPAFVLDDPGSVFFLGAGERVRYQRTLAAGLYLYVVPRVDGAPQLDRRAYHLVRVVARGERMSVDGGRIVSLRDDAVVLSRVNPGSGRYVIANDGTIPHELFVVGVRVPADLDRGDALGAWLEGGQVGSPPFPVHLPGSHHTIAPGVRVVLTWELHHSTTYAFVDFATGASATATLR